MNNFFVRDVSRSDMLGSQYDFGIFSLGYEPRCTFAPSILDRTKIEKAIILAHSEHANLQRENGSDRVFGSLFPNAVVFNDSGNDFSGLFQNLQDIISSKDLKKIRVLIDYSSMTKSWLATLVYFFFNHAQNELSIQLESIDFIYSVGDYPDILSINSFSPPYILPGCGGAPLTARKKTCIFSLGFDPVGPQSVHNILNPDKIFVTYASPGAADKYVEKVKSLNLDFISSFITDKSQLLGLPLASVDTVFDNLQQIALPFIDKDNVSIALFGPKPHTLAAILLSNFYPNITCLSSKGINSQPRIIGSNGEVVITRCEFSD